MLAIWIGKLALWTLRLLGRKGTSLPGQLALRLNPRILEALGRQLTSCIVVTGTNGKTTTTALLAAVLRVRGPVVVNTDGANLQQGLVSALLVHTDWFGRLRTKTALFEVDEATLPRVAAVLPIRWVVVTNLFRDQLDRYGELDLALAKIRDGLQQTDAGLVWNADDPLVCRLGAETRRQGKPQVSFGLHPDHLQPPWRDLVRDGAFCLACGNRLQYDGFFYGQLGVYRCCHCGFARPDPDVVGRLESASLIVQSRHWPSPAAHGNRLAADPAGAGTFADQASIALPVRGLYNAYNALAAISLLAELGFQPDEIQAGWASFQPPLGRMQVFATRPTSVLNLVKNPAGCDSVLRAILAEPGDKVLCVAINDQAADGRDVSWLWDADFELVADLGGVARCVTTGMRAEDMALRLKYAGYPPGHIECVPDLAAGVAQALAAGWSLGGLSVYVLATYTALHPVAQLLAERVVADADPTQAAVHRASVS
ncbi:MAG: DUF1727 domain-containing protein [Alicyclobacillaceae bacterium]|nr:DUF1727 domain-containing protein [Alicyclobacillaceae bacterium]